MSVLFTRRGTAPVKSMKASDLPIGSSVFFHMSKELAALMETPDLLNERIEFIVVHQGLPSSMYDSSCNGTWLMTKETSGAGSFGTTNEFIESMITSME